MKIKSEFQESRYKSSHSMTLHGKKISFDVIAEDYVFTDETGNDEASLFSYSYIRTNVPANTNRPVMFVWDGGPGAGSASEQLNFFGPWRIKSDNDSNFAPAIPPYELEDNPHCLLDVCDIVMIDPVGTGFGRLLNPEKLSKYASSVSDTRITADFIETWLTQYDRWNTPLYLCGSSYGTIRCARTAEELNGGAFYKNGRQRSIAVAGMILIGNSSWLPTESIAAEENSASAMLPAGTYPEVLLLPSLAAANWYHSPELQNESLDNYCERAWKLAWEKLEPFSAGKVSCTEDETAELAAEMSALIGIPAETLLSMNLKIQQSEVYAAIRLAGQGRDLGIYDSRMTLAQNPEIGVPDPAGDDPAMSVYTVPMMAVMNSSFKKKLGITFDRSFVDVNYAMNAAWDYSTPEMLVPQIPARTHNQCLAAAMRRNESMKLLFANGTYDMITWSGLNRYTAENSGLPQDRTFFKRYPGGHYAFSGEEAAAKFEEDLRNLFFS